ncbi:MAG: Trm112 family protein [Limisphaerales bacterium]
MNYPELLKILCCPETHQEVRSAEPEVIDKLNARIAAGTVTNRSGQLVKETIEGGLIRADGKLLYPIRRNIPVMLVDEGIPLAG